MRRLDWRIVVGILLILAGALSLLEKVGVIPPGINVFGVIIGLGGGAAFLYLFLKNPRAQWWAALPAFTLLGLGTAGFLPEGLDGVAFLGGDRSGFLGDLPDQPPALVGHHSRRCPVDTGSHFRTLRDDGPGGYRERLFSRPGTDISAGCPAGAA